MDTVRVTDLVPPPRPWRLSSRLLVIDRRDRLLLIRARDPEGGPGSGGVSEWWEVPGGGVEAGEDSAAAAVRETGEETGFLVPPRIVGPVCWRGETTYLWAYQRYWARVVIHLARPQRSLRRRRTGWLTDEQASFLGVSWVPLADVRSGTARYFPATLPADLPRLLGGETVHAPFTVWS